MNILHLSGAMIWGGNEQQQSDLWYNLEKLGVNSFVFCFNGSAVEKYVQQQDIQYYSIPKSSSFSSRVQKAIVHCISTFKIDIIHIHTSNMVGSYLRYSWTQKTIVPAVYSKKGLSVNSSFLSKIKYNNKNIQVYTCISQAVKDSFLPLLNKKNQKKVHTIYDGIRLDNNQETVPSLRKKYDIDANKIIVGNVANHYSAKDIPTFIATAHHIVHEKGMDNIVFVNIGDFSRYTTEFQDLMKKYKLESNFIFTGFLENASAYINQYDIFLMTSQEEGLGLVILESFKAGIPVVATNAGGIPEAVIDGYTGLLAPIKDYRKLSDNVLTIIGDAELKGTLIRNAKNHLEEHFNAMGCAEKMQQLYKTI